MIIDIGGNISSFDVFDSKIFDIETNVVTWGGLSKLFMMHFNRFNFSGLSRRWEFNNHTWFDDTSFDSTDWDSSNTRDFVYIL